MAEPIVLRGLDGANPLAFLAALGTLRVLALGAGTAEQPRLAWRVDTGKWRPFLSGVDATAENNLCQAFRHSAAQYGIGGVDATVEKNLCQAIAKAGNALDTARLLPESDDLNIPAAEYRVYAKSAQSAVNVGARRSAHADFAAAFACDALVNDDGTVQDTALRTMSGAGHQHFLRTMRSLIAQTSVEHIHKALFAPWRYDDPVRNMTLRWDPSDDSRYALRWSDPSGDRERQYRGAMWGANRLAIEGLPILPVMPTRKQLETVGFRTAGARGTFWTWPIWETPVELDNLRALLEISELQEDTPNRVALRARGVVEVFRSQRLTVGKFRNFTWGLPV
jgi:hypothetical protein